MKEPEQPMGPILPLFSLPLPLNYASPDRSTQKGSYVFLLALNVSVWKQEIMGLFPGDLHVIQTVSLEENEIRSQMRCFQVDVYEGWLSLDRTCMFRTGAGRL